MAHREADEIRLASCAGTGQRRAQMIARGVDRHALAVGEAVLDRLRQRFDAAFAPSDPRLATLAYADGDTTAAGDNSPIHARGRTVWNSWGEAFGSWGDFRGDGNAASFDRSIGGFVAGADVTIDGTWRLGIATGYQAVGLDVPDRASSVSDEGYHLAAYGGFADGPFAFRLGGAYSWHDIDTERQVAFPGFADSLHASYDADVAQAFAEVGYAMSAGSLAVEPFGGLAYVGLHTNGFSETGGAAALTGAGGDTDITYGSLGARFGTTLPIGGGRAIARGMIAWQHALDGVTPKSVLAFDGGTGLPFFGRRHPDRRGHAEARGRPRLGARRSRDRKPRLFWRDRGACAGPRAQGEAIDQLLARRTAHRPKRRGGPSLRSGHRPSAEIHGRIWPPCPHRKCGTDYTGRLSTPRCESLQANH